MKYELHERILLYLYKHRDTTDQYDLLLEFKGISRDLISEKAEELEKMGFIETRYPYIGFGSVDRNTGLFRFPHADKGDFIKARILTTGIDYVRQNIKKKEKESTIMKIFLAIAAPVIVALILYYFFGIH